MFYFVYKTTNLVNGKFYIGAHKTDNLRDGYLGSGLALRRAILKYGKHNFKRQIIGICEDLQSMYALEKEIVTGEFIKNPQVYNAKIGGWGGSDDVEHLKSIALIGTKRSRDLRKDPEWYKKNYPNGCKHLLKYSGVKHTDASKAKMKEATKKKVYASGRPSSSGYVWIKKDELSKTVKSSELSSFLLDGWIKGRIYPKKV